MRGAHIGQSVAAHVGPGTYLRRERDGMSSLFRALKARRWRYRVIRFDGVLLSVTNDRETAERMARVMREGQRADHVVVLHPSASRR